MTISRVSHAIANGDTLTMPTHQAGDLIIAIVYRNDSTAAPTRPSGWLRVRELANNTNNISSFRRIATSSSETFGTWTNATQVAAVVYRDTDNYLIRGASSVAGQANDTISYAIVAGGNIIEQDGNRYFIGISGYRANNTSGIAAPTGMTSIANIQGASAGSLQIHDTDGLVSGWSAQTVSGSSLTAWVAQVIEIYDTRIPLSAAAPAKPNLRGGFAN